MPNNVSCEYRFGLWRLAHTNARAMTDRLLGKLHSALFASRGGVFRLELGDDLTEAHGRACRAIAWTRCGDATSPPVAGTIAISRFGPFIHVRVRVRYVYGSDAASELAHEAVGDVLVRASLRYLRIALVAALENEILEAPVRA